MDALLVPVNYLLTSVEKGVYASTLAQRVPGAHPRYPAVGSRRQELPNTPLER